MLARLPATESDKTPSAVAEALQKVRQAIPGADVVMDTASDHRSALIVGGLALMVMATRPWRLLAKPKVLFTLAVPAAAYGLKKVPTRVWMNLAVGAVRIVWARRTSRQRRRNEVREQRDRAGPP